MKLETRDSILDTEKTHGGNVDISRDCHLGAFLFDVDGVLADTAGLHTRAWGRVASEEGLQFDTVLAESLRGLSREDSLKRILGGRRLEACGFESLLERKNNYYVESLSQLGSEDAMPGARTLIEELAESEIKMAAVSASRNALRVLQQIGLLDKLEAIIDGNCTSANRYLAAADRLGVLPNRCVALEDSPAGIALARSAGMRVIGIGDNGLRLTADLTLGSFRHISLRNIISRLGAVAELESCHTSTGSGTGSKSGTRSPNEDVWRTALRTIF